MPGRDRRRPLVTRMFDSSDGGIELHLVLLAIAVVGLLLLGAATLAWHAEKFSLAELGQGLGILFGGGAFCCAGQGIQRKCENDVKVVVDNPDNH